MKKPRRNANITQALKKYPHFKNGVKKGLFYADGVYFSVLDSV
ncbi:hypothetical protein [Methylophaga thiooxydans]|nr:hypothetical protein [Methylophaga thiooxydans]